MSDKLVLIAPTITGADKEEQVATYLKRHGFVKTIWHLYEHIWDESDLKEAEDAVKNRKKESPFYDLLFKEYNIEKHFKQTDSHKIWIMEAYDRLRDFVPHMTKEDAKVHDVSKYDLVQAIGYTAKWVYNVDWGNEIWQKSLRDHYRRESHHPEFSEGQTMIRKDLEESLIDMVASRWERQLGGNKNASNFDLVNFEPEYLRRYCKKDLIDVQALIEKVKMADIPAYRWKLIERLVPESRLDEVRKVYEGKGFHETIWYLVQSVWNQDDISSAERGLKDRDPENKFYQLLYIEYDVQEHYRLTDSHREWVYKSYKRLKNFVSNVTEEDAKVHDLSKYDFVQAIGYTAKWVHEVDWNNEIWQKSLENHFKRESHHPQYFPKHQTMTRKDLEESLVDMVACGWERDLEGNKDSSLFELVNFNPVYLKRYCKEDYRDVTSLIKIIQEHPEEV